MLIEAARSWSIWALYDAKHKFHIIINNWYALADVGRSMFKSFFYMIQMVRWDKIISILSSYTKQVHNNLLNLTGKFKIRIYIIIIWLYVSTDHWAPHILKFSQLLLSEWIHFFFNNTYIPNVMCAWNFYEQYQQRLHILVIFNISKR